MADYELESLQIVIFYYLKLSTQRFHNRFQDFRMDLKTYGS